MKNLNHCLTIHPFSQVRDGCYCFLAIWVVSVTSLVSLLMFLLNSFLSFGKWDTQTQSMFHLKSSWQYFYTAVLQAYQFGMLESDFRDQMRQGLGLSSSIFLNIYLVIFEKCFSFSQHHHFTQHISVCLPTADDPPPDEIRNNPKLWPFFKDAIGALDGSHIHISSPASERASYRNCKGFISQNCLFACDFSLKFVYALTGWEGSAMDAWIYKDAPTHDLLIPPHKYYLADAGFPLCDQLLIPYWSVHYQIAEAMWEDYQCHLVDREIEDMDVDSNGFDIMEDDSSVSPRQWHQWILGLFFSLTGQTIINLIVQMQHKIQVITTYTIASGTERESLRQHSQKIKITQLALT